MSKFHLDNFKQKKPRHFKNQSYLSNDISLKDEFISNAVFDFGNFNVSEPKMNLKHDFAKNKNRSRKQVSSKSRVFNYFPQHMEPTPQVSTFRTEFSFLPKKTIYSRKISSIVPSETDKVTLSRCAKKNLIRKPNYDNELKSHNIFFPLLIKTNKTKRRDSMKNLKDDTGGIYFIENFKYLNFYDSRF